MDFLNLERVLLLHNSLRILLVLVSDLQGATRKLMLYTNRAYCLQIFVLKKKKKKKKMKILYRVNVCNLNLVNSIKQDLTQMGIIIC